MKTQFDRMDRPEAIKLGLHKYFTTRPCIRGHMALRYTKTGVCTACIPGYNRNVQEKEALAAVGMVKVKVKVHEDDVAVLHGTVAELNRRRAVAAASQGLPQTYQGVAGLPKGLKEVRLTIPVPPDGTPTDYKSLFITHINRLRRERGLAAYVLNKPYIRNGEMIVKAVVHCDDVITLTKFTEGLWGAHRLQYQPRGDRTPVFDIPERNT